MQNKRHTKHLQQQNAATEKCCKPRKDAEPKWHRPQNTCNRYRPMLASLTAIGHWQINMTFTDGSGRWLYADLLYIYIFSQCSITDVVAICRLIVGHFNIVGHSPPTYLRLQAVQIQLGIDQKTYSKMFPLAGTVPFTWWRACWNKSAHLLYMLQTTTSLPLSERTSGI